MMTGKARIKAKHHARTTEEEDKVAFWGVFLKTE